MGFSYATNFIQQQQVVTELNNTMTPQNYKMYADANKTRDRAYQAAHKVLGDDSDAEVFVYRFNAIIPMATVHNPDALPRLDGVTRQGQNLRVSTLVTRVWWTQKLLWYWPRDAMAQKITIVPDHQIGFGFRRPESDFDFVQDPAMVVDSAR